MALPTLSGLGLTVAEAPVSRSCIAHAIVRTAHHYDHCGFVQSGLAFTGEMDLNELEKLPISGLAKYVRGFWLRTATRRRNSGLRELAQGPLKSLENVAKPKGALEAQVYFLRIDTSRRGVAVSAIPSSRTLLRP